MKVKTKVIIALIMLVIMIIATFPLRSTKVFAEGNYVVTFEVKEGTHTLTLSGTTDLGIDGNYLAVEDRSGETPVKLGTFARVSDTKYTLTIPNGQSGELTFNSGNAFSLFVGSSQVSAGYGISGTTNIDIKDYVAPSNPPQQPPQTPTTPTEAGLYFRLNDAGTVWYKFSTQSSFTELSVAGGVQETVAIPSGATSVTVKGESERTFEHIAADVNGNITNISADNFKSTDGVNVALTNESIAILTVDYLQDTQTPRFDGNAYFCWLDEDDHVCYHKFTGMLGEDTQNGGYLMNYINLTDMTDQSANGVNYQWKQEPANWVLAKDLEDGEHNLIAERLTKLYIFGDGTDQDHGVQLNPTNAQDGENSKCSNGDMNFRVTIYRDEYQGLTFGTKASDYTYFPTWWDQVFFTSTVDISGSSATNPAEYNTYLLEPNIKFTKAPHSDNITGVEALNVNPDAVTITESAGEYTIVFNSNYFDNVVFKITTASETYYVKINRIVLDIHDNFAPGVTDKKLIAFLSYDASKTYTDYEVYATTVYKDGTKQMSKLEPQKIVWNNDPLSPGETLINDYTAKAGQGLRASCYHVPVNDNVAGVYFTAINKPSATTTVYSGTLAGSGQGSYFNLETRRVEY